MKKTSNPMRVLARVPLLSRRAFLGRSSLAAAGLAAVPLVAVAAPKTTSVARAFPTLGAATGALLLKAARDIFPHDRLADRHYLAAVAPYDRRAAGDPALRRLLREGSAGLDAAVRHRFGRAYVEVPAEADRVALLKAIETTPFFERLRGDLVTGLYDNKEVWPLLGYEGSSWEKGGYLMRGFDDIDWLPD